MRSAKELLEFELIHIGDYIINLFDVLILLAFIFSARFIVWGITKILKKRLFNQPDFDRGRQFAFSRLIRYVVYTIFLMAALESIGIKLSVIWGGLAALLVGLGLGLQHIFNDLMSGLFLLFEGNLHVGDVIEVDDLVGEVKRIGVRTTDIETRRGITIVVPNSKFTMENVINWTKNRRPTMFSIEVGVAYGSDVELVRKVLTEVAMQESLVLKEPSIFVKFENFGNSSLDFKLLFWSEEAWRIEVIKSDLRYRIDAAFRENNITIPFPQQDLHIKSSDISFKA